MILYTSGASQWAGVAHLGLVEKGYGTDDVEEVEVNFSSFVLPVKGVTLLTKSCSQCG